MARKHRNLVSLVIPTRNRPTVLGKCLDAIFRLDSRQLLREIIVVQDGSHLEVQTLMSSIRPPDGIRLRCLSQPPSGANAARNRGIQESVGDVVVLIDDDSVAPAGWLRKLLEPFRDRAVEVVVGASRLPLDGAILGRHREELQALLGEVVSPAVTSDGRPIPVACNMAVRRKVFNRGLFDETLKPPVEETEWFLRVHARSHFEPKAWVWHWKTADDVRLVPILKGAWKRGFEGGRWSSRHENWSVPARLRDMIRSSNTTFHSLGHATIRRCWGGLVTAAGEMGRMVAVAGLFGRGGGKAVPWR